jgi:hypothetical protein
MNIPAGFVSQIQELIFQQSQPAGRCEQVLSALKTLVAQLIDGCSVPLAVGICLVAGLAFVYRPRMRRGSLWVPGFGLFGGVPTLYLHTRPASVCGFFSPFKRLRHRRSGLHRRRVRA